MFTLKEDNREKNIIEFFERAEKLSKSFPVFRTIENCL